MGSAFVSQVVKEVAGVLSITLKNATAKHAQTIGTLEQSHASIKQALKTDTDERRSLWHKYLNIAVLYYNASYHRSIGCDPSREFHGRFPYNVLILELGILPQQTPIPTSEIAQQVLDRTEMICQDGSKNAIQADIKDEKYYDREANASKFKKVKYVYVIQPKADHQGSKYRFAEFRWIRPYVIEKLLPNNVYLVSKVGTNKTQKLHRMRLRQFTPRQCRPVVQITRQEWNSDPEVTNEHADLYARAWECDYERPNFDADCNNTTPPDPPEIAVQFDLPPEEMWNTSRTSRERSPNVFPSSDGLCDGTDTYH